MKTILQRAALLTSGLLLAGQAAAHADGSVLHTHGILDGVLHPFTGWDHALVALVVGVLVAQRGAQQLRTMPLLFIGGMALAMLAGALWLPGSWVEGGIVLSMAAVGLLLALPRAGSNAAAAIPVVLFAGASHGLIHGVEAGLHAFYLAGILLGTAALHATGIALGRQLLAHTLLLRSLGLGVLLTGVGVLVAG